MGVRHSYLGKVEDIPRSLLDNLEHQIHQAFGHNVQLEFEFPDEIPVLPSGKHRYAFSELGDDNI